MNGRDVSAINHSRDLRAAKNEEARVSVRIVLSIYTYAYARRLGAVKKFSMMKRPCESGARITQNKHLDDSGRLAHRSEKTRTPSLRGRLNTKTPYADKPARCSED